MMGAALPDDWAEIGDLNIGATLTFGMPHIGGSSDEWFLSDYLVVWMMNPSVTQIPDAHFLFEAKYNGAELVVIDPHLQRHRDPRRPAGCRSRPGTDAALGLATARHIWDSGRIDLAYVREQTDLPLLVRLDTGRFLRESDLVARGRDDLLLRLGSGARVAWPRRPAPRAIASSRSSSMRRPRAADRRPLRGDARRRQRGRRRAGRLAAPRAARAVDLRARRRRHAVSTRGGRQTSPNASPARSGRWCSRAGARTATCTRT